MQPRSQIECIKYDKTSIAWAHKREEKVTSTEEINSSLTLNNDKIAL